MPSTGPAGFWQGPRSRRRCLPEPGEGSCSSQARGQQVHVSHSVSRLPGGKKKKKEARSAWRGRAGSDKAPSLPGRRAREPLACCQADPDPDPSLSALLYGKGRLLPRTPHHSTAIPASPMAGGNFGSTRLQEVLNLKGPRTRPPLVSTQLPKGLGRWALFRRTRYAAAHQNSFF